MIGGRGDTGRITVGEVARIALAFGCVAALGVILGDSALERTTQGAAVVVGTLFMSWGQHPPSGE